jgi:arylsulfatase A-like enzyme
VRLAIRRLSLIAGASIAATVAAGGVLWRATHPQARNVVIITLDTTRADRLSPYGLRDVSMPALERLASEGVVFDQASSVAPLTLPAHCTLFTGLLPPSHWVRDNADPPLAS